MRTKKKNKRIKLTTVLIYILLLSVIIVNVTLARYKTSESFMSSATAAAWSFKLSIDDEILAQTFQVDLANTVMEDNNISEGVLAPGSRGKFTLNIDCSGCEVGVEYSITLSDLTGEVPSGLKFYNSPNFENSTEMPLNVPIDGIIDLEEVNTIKSETIYWKWITNSNIDETMYKNKQISVGMKVVGTQLLKKAITAEDFFDVTSSGELTLKTEKISEFREQITMLSIPTSIDGIDVTSISEFAFAEFTNLESLIINSGEITINKGAFANCTSIKNVSILSTNTTIGDNAFDGCTSLIRVNFSGSVNTIGKWSFRDCKLLTSINLPNTITSIGESAFYNCTSINSIILPTDITKINKWTFWNCYNLNNIIIPNNVISVEEGAFGKCSNLNHINFGTSLETIKNSAFYCCTAIETVDVPSNVITIEDYAFQDCIELTILTITNSTTVSPTAFYGCIKLSR